MATRRPVDGYGGGDHTGSDPANASWHLRKLVERGVEVMHSALETQE